MASKKYSSVFLVMNIFIYWLPNHYFPSFLLFFQKYLTYFVHTPIHNQFMTLNLMKNQMNFIFLSAFDKNFSFILVDLVLFLFITRKFPVSWSSMSYWMKNFSLLHQRLIQNFSDCFDTLMNFISLVFISWSIL